MKRYQIHFQGRVQGVGFRATTRSIARDFSVTGQVQNMADGSVKLVVEGKQDQVDAFLKAILRHMDRYITTHHVETQQPSGEFGLVDGSQSHGKVVIV